MPNKRQYSHLTTGQEPEMMAIVLEAEHGLHAAEVADFFASLHMKRGDESRSRAWANVATRIRLREHQRVLQD